MGKYSIDKTPADVLEETAARHRSLRRSLKMSRAELADRSGVSAFSIKRFENTGQVSLESLLKLLLILNRLNDFDAVLKPRQNMADIEKLFH